MSQYRSVVRGRVGVLREASGLALALVLAGLLAGQSLAAPQEPAPSPPSTPAGAGPETDLSTRYRLIERYSLTEEKPRPEMIGPYRVAIRESIRVVTEKARGAPDRSETSAQTIYTERPAQVNDVSVVTAAVRRYDTFRLPTDPKTKPSTTPPLEALTVWYQVRSGDDPLVLSLTENRRLRDYEYNIISRQVFLPELAAVLLPQVAYRIGDSWNLAPLAVKTLIGERPPRGQMLRAKLAEVRTDPKTSRLVAVITISGKVGQPGGEVSVNVQLLFTFTPVSQAMNEAGVATDAAAPAVKAGDEGIVDAWGAITEVRMAIAKTSAQPGSGRLRRIQTNELVLGRQLDTGNTPPPSVPQEPPTPNEGNSWLTYADPRGRFHFQHPQDLRPSAQSTPDLVELLDMQPAGPDIVAVEMLAKSGNPQEDARLRDPEYHRKRLMDDWREGGLESIPGSHGWLPESDWAASKMKVYRISVALKPGNRTAKGPVNRIYADYYVVLLSRNETLFVSATTVKDPPAAFRAQAEAILKTFRFDAPETTR